MPAKWGLSGANGPRISPMKESRDREIRGNIINGPVRRLIGAV